MAGVAGGLRSSVGGKRGRRQGATVKWDLPWEKGQEQKQARPAPAPAPPRTVRVSDADGGHEVSVVGVVRQHRARKDR